MRRRRRSGPRRSQQTVDSIAQDIEAILNDLQAMGYNPALIAKARADLAEARKPPARCGRSVTVKCTVKRQALPWEAIDSVRQEGMTWQEIADWLGACGIHVSSCRPNQPR